MGRPTLTDARAALSTAANKAASATGTALDQARDSDAAARLRASATQAQIRAGAAAETAKGVAAAATAAAKAGLERRRGEDGADVVTDDSVDTDDECPKRKTPKLPTKSPAQLEEQRRQIAERATRESAEAEAAAKAATEEQAQREADLGKRLRAALPGSPGELVEEVETAAAAASTIPTPPTTQKTFPRWVKVHLPLVASAFMAGIALTGVGILLKLSFFGFIAAPLVAAVGINGIGIMAIICAVIAANIPAVLLIKAIIKDIKAEQQKTHAATASTNEAAMPASLFSTFIKIFGCKDQAVDVPEHPHAQPPSNSHNDKRPHHASGGFSRFPKPDASQATTPSHTSSVTP